MRVEIVTTVGELDLDEWDALLGPGDLYMSSSWLPIAEETAAAPPLYLVVRDGAGHACAAVACYPLESEAPYPFSRLDWVLATAGADRQDAQRPRLGDLCRLRRRADRVEHRRRDKQ